VETELRLAAVEVMTGHLSRKQALDRAVDSMKPKGSFMGQVRGKA
jgi:hypothetical protein